MKFQKSWWNPKIAEPISLEVAISREVQKAALHGDIAPVISTLFAALVSKLSEEERIQIAKLLGYEVAP